jgi:hypothetical protein
LLVFLSSFNLIHLIFFLLTNCSVLQDSSKAVSARSQNALTLSPMDLMTRHSIFHALSSENLRNPDSYCVLSNTFSCNTSTCASSDIPFPVTSCSWLNSRGKANFALADYSGNLSIVEMESSASSRKIIILDLKQTTIMDRLWHNLVPSIISRTTKESDQAAASIVYHKNPLDAGNLIFALCRDFRIRVWCAERQECLLSHNLDSDYQEITSNISQNVNFITSKLSCLYQ